MPIVRFIGRVSPKTVKIDARMPELRWKWDEAALELLIRIVVAGSHVTVEVETATYEHKLHFTEFHKRADDIARSTVNLSAFATGLGISVTLHAAILPDGNMTQILPQDPGLQALCTTYSLEPSASHDFGRIVQLVLTDPPLFRALDDLIAAITQYHVSCVNCGRVVDSICRMINPSASSGPSKAAWAAMHQALNVARSYQEWISMQAKGPRHGDPSFVPGTVTTEVTHRTWALMNRFLAYRLRGNVPLTSPEFPLLS
ncbi:MAG: hypothetical protein J0H67_02010 [Rhodospirillales bacterium]|nr:hypothetical protein [Rhodospirillales bacterium]